MERNTRLPSEAAYGGTTGATEGPLASAAPASPKGVLDFAYFLVIPRVPLFPVPDRQNSYFLWRTTRDSHEFLCLS